MKRCLVFVIGCMALTGVQIQAEAEPPVHLSPVDIFGVFGGAMHGPSAPIRLQAACSQELGDCWEAHGMNKDNADQVQDTCWREATKKCPKVCRDEYFSRRKAGMQPRAADPLFRGRHSEDTSCVPGVDELTHPMGKVKTNDSAVRVSVMVGRQAAKAEIYAAPVDAQGNEEKRTTSSPNYSGGNAYRDLSEPILLNLPAGRYRLHVLSSDRFYHPDQAFPEQVELIVVGAGQTLDKVFSFRMGHLVVKAKNTDGKPVAATFELRRYDRPDYVLLRASLPLDKALLAGKYSLAVKASKSRKVKSFDIELKANRTMMKTATFVENTVKETSAKRAATCFNQVQGKISWSVSTGYAKWNPANIHRLCRGEENSNQPPTCFDCVMHSDIPHGNDGKQWIWQDALDLCEGTPNASETSHSTLWQIKKGYPWSARTG